MFFFIGIIDCLYFQGWVQAHGNAYCEGAHCGRVPSARGRTNSGKWGVSQTGATVMSELKEKGRWFGWGVLKISKNEQAYIFSRAVYILPLVVGRNLVVIWIGLQCFRLSLWDLGSDMPPPTHLACFYEWIASEATVCSRPLSLDAFCSEELLLGMFYEWNSSEATVLPTDQSRRFLFVSKELFFGQRGFVSVWLLRNERAIWSWSAGWWWGIGGIWRGEERGDVSTYIFCILCDALCVCFVLWVCNENVLVLNGLVNLLLLVVCWDMKIVLFMAYR